jgi:putative transposase
LGEESVRKRRQMINFTHDALSVRTQCHLLGLNRSAVYYDAKPDVDTAEIMNEIHEIWVSTPFYGYRRICAELRRRGYAVNHKRVQRIMKKLNLKAIYPKQNLSRSNAAHPKYPYLLKDLVIGSVNMVWCTDITYIKMSNGFVYLVAIIDVYSRYIVNWRLSITLDTDFCLDMLEDSLALVTPQFFNTDQGVQFTSDAWISRVKFSGAKVSMDGKGRWADNIPIERFWRSLKYEGVLLHAYETVAKAREQLGKYINFYNEKRPHQSLKYATPGEVYRQEKMAMPYSFSRDDMSLTAKDEKLLSLKRGESMCDLCTPCELPNMEVRI